MAPLIVMDIYRSENGDRWQLIYDGASDHYFVRHEPNFSSGGNVTDVGLRAFLDRSGRSPQNEALRALLEKEGISPEPE